jgi:hypothetical protein
LAVSTSRNIRLFDNSKSTELIPLGTVDGQRCVEGRVSKGLDSRRVFVLDEAVRALDGWYVGCTMLTQGVRRGVAGYDGGKRAVTLDADLPQTARAGDSYVLEREEAFFQARARLSLTPPRLAGAGPRCAASKLPLARPVRPPYSVRGLQQLQ